MFRTHRKVTVTRWCRHALTPKRVQSALTEPRTSARRLRSFSTSWTRRIADETLRWGTQTPHDPVVSRPRGFSTRPSRRCVPPSATLPIVSPNSRPFGSALFPPDGSWLSRLREENPSWVDGIGRVVDPDLLLRTDLDPSFESAGSNFYGWQLTVSALEPVEAAREEGDLRERLSQADARYKEAKDAAEGTDNEAETAARRHDEAKRSNEQAQQAVRRLSATREDVLARQRSQREAIDQAVTERTLLAKKDIARLESRIKEFDQRLQDRQDALKSAHYEALNELQSQHAIDRSRLDD